MPRFREDVEIEEPVNEEEGIPEKFHGKSRKDIAMSYTEAERLMHEKTAEAAKLKTMLDMRDISSSQQSGSTNGSDSSHEKPAAGSDEALNETLKTYGRAIYHAAMQDSLTMFEVREGLKDYLGQHRHLKKAGKLFQSAVQEAMASAQGDSSKTLFDVLERARISVEETIKEAGGTVNSNTSARSRLLEGGESVESRSATKRREQSKEDEEDTSLDSYLAERRTRRSLSV